MEEKYGGKMRREGNKTKEIIYRGCRFHCTESFSETDGFQLITECNNKTNHVQQKNNILSNTEVLDIERQRLCIAGQRQKTRDVSMQYFLRREGVRTRVCNKFFTSTLNIDHSSVTEAVKGRGTSGAFVGVDNRGTHVPSNKTPESDFEKGSGTH